MVNLTVKSVNKMVKYIFVHNQHKTKIVQQIIVNKGHTQPHTGYSYSLVGQESVLLEHDPSSLSIPEKGYLPHHVLLCFVFVLI